MSIDLNDVICLIPDKHGGLSVCDLMQLVMNVDEAEDIDELIENSSFDMTLSSYAFLKDGEPVAYNVNGFIRTIIKARQLIETGDVAAYHETQGWEK